MGVYYVRCDSVGDVLVAVLWVVSIALIAHLCLTDWLTGGKIENQTNHDNLTETEKQQSLLTYVVLKP